jgi:hypothetical protein
MKTRELGAVLKLLRANGVRSFADGSISITFDARDTGRPEPVAVEGEDDRPLDLPEGLVDPREHLKRINARRATESS